MDGWVNILLSWGVPTTLCSAIVGLFVWDFKRKIEQRDKARDEREKNIETMILLITQTGRATNILAEATARAVQRIPDAQCNGDMATALEKVEEIQRKEQQFLIDHGIKHIFGD